MQQRIGRGFRRRDVLEADDHIEVAPQVGSLQLGLHQGTPLAGDDTHGCPRAMELADQGRDTAKDPGVTEPGIGLAISGYQGLPDIGRYQLHLFRQRQATTLLEECTGLLVQVVRAHYVCERLLDQRVAVNQRPVEVENYAAGMSVNTCRKCRRVENRPWIACQT